MIATPARNSDPLALPPVPPRASGAHPWRDRIVAAVFALALAVPLVGAIKKRNLEMTAYENRRTAPWPAAPSGLTTFRRFPPAFEAAFADRFGGRDKLIALHHATDKDIFGISPVANVLLGRDGWLYFLGEDGTSLDRDYRGTTPYSPNEAGQVAAELKRRRDFLASLGIAYVATAGSTGEDGKSLDRDRGVSIPRRTRLKRRRDFLASLGIAYVVAIVPDKYTIYPEFLPPWIARVRGETRLDRLYAALGKYPDVDVLDLRPALRAAKEHDRLYYKTDSHWNYLGAMAGYDALIAAVKARVPAVPGVPGERPPYDRGLDFYSGDLTMLLGMSDTLREDDVAPIGKVLSNAERHCAKQSDERPAAAPPAETLVYLCNRPELPTALVYRDSMAISLIPLLSENFRRVVYVSDRRLDPALVKAEKPDVVIEEMVERSMHGPAALPMPF